MNEMPEQRPLTPDELADYLDTWLDNDTPPNTADPLLETAARLHHAPHPALDSAAFARIQQRVMDAAPATTQATIAQGQHLARMVGMIFVGFIILLVIALIVWAAQMMTPAAISTPEATFSNTEITLEAELVATDFVQPSATLTRTSTATATLTGTVSATPSPTLTGTVSATPSATQTATVSATPPTVVTATLLPVIVVTAAPISVNVPLTNNNAGSGSTNNANNAGNNGGTSGGTQPNTLTDPNPVDWDNQPCDNPPPPWATANGWRARCGGQPTAPNPAGNQPANPGNSGNNGGGNNGGGNGGGRGSDKGSDKGS